MSRYNDVYIHVHSRSWRCTIHILYTDLNYFLTKKSYSINLCVTDGAKFDKKFGADSSKSERNFKAT